MAQTYDPYEETDKYVKEGCKINGLTMRIGRERVEVDDVRKVMGQVLYQPHMVVGILKLEPDPVASEDVMIGEIGTQEQGEAKDESESHTANNCS